MSTFAVISGITFLSGTTSADTGVLKDGANSEQIYIYYFYFTPRCEECIIVEKAILKVLNGYYSQEVKNKRIIFQEINLTDPDPESRKIMQELRVRRQLFLLVHGEVIVNLTKDAFRYAENQYDQFRDIMKNAIDQVLSQ
jgi:hypothetical protein